MFATTNAKNEQLSHFKLKDDRDNLILLGDYGPKCAAANINISLAKVAMV